MNNKYSRFLHFDIIQYYICFIALAFLFIQSENSFAQKDILADSIETLKESVVNLEITIPKNIGFDDSGKGYATGFIVDVKGLIVTNRHVTSTSPTTVKITFRDGSSTEGKVIYYDYYHDFGFIYFDPLKVSFPLQAVTFGSSFALKEYDEVLLIGNNEKEEYSVKKGRITSLHKNKGDLHSDTLFTSFDRTKGSSGSPVWNAQGEVIGLHFAGTDTSSFELRIEYIKDALNEIIKGNEPPRRDIGVKLDLLMFEDAVKYLKLPLNYQDAYKRLFPGEKNIVVIKSIIPRSPASDELKAGDIIWSIGRGDILFPSKNTVIGNNLYLFDKLINELKEETVQLTVIRNGQVQVLYVTPDNLNQQKTKAFALFAGGTFQDIPREFRVDYNFVGEGVLMNSIVKGSTFELIGAWKEKNPTFRRVVIIALDGKPVTNLEDFLHIASTLNDKEHIAVTYQDCFGKESIPTMELLTLELTYNPLQLFVLTKDDQQLFEVWKEVQASVLIKTQ